MLVSQRPSELPDTALSQCGTMIALRLTNSADQGRIRSALPDSIEGLATVLPSLRTGEAIVSGEAVTLPARVQVNRPDPMPKSEDPSTGVWRKQKELPDVTICTPRMEGDLSGGDKTIMTPQWQPVDSTRITHEAYDPDNECTLVRFSRWCRVVLQSLPTERLENIHNSGAVSWSIH